MALLCKSSKLFCWVIGKAAHAGDPYSKMGRMYDLYTFNKMSLFAVLYESLFKRKIDDDAALLMY